MKIITPCRPLWPQNARCGTCCTRVELDFDDLAMGFASRVTWKCPVCGCETYADNDLTQAHRAEAGIREKLGDDEDEFIQPDPVREVGSFIDLPHPPHRKRFRLGRNDSMGPR